MVLTWRIVGSKKLSRDYVYLGFQCLLTYIIYCETYFVVLCYSELNAVFDQWFSYVRSPDPFFATAGLRVRLLDHTFFVLGDCP